MSSTIFIQPGERNSPLQLNMFKTGGTARKRETQIKYEKGKGVYEDSWAWDQERTLGQGLRERRGRVREEESGLVVGASNRLGDLQARGRKGQRCTDATTNPSREALTDFLSPMT